METGAIIVFGVFGFIGLSFLVIFVLKKLKGNIKLNLSKKLYYSNEDIVGSFEFKTRKPIQSNALVVELEAYRQDRQSNFSRTQNSSQYYKVYSQPQQIEGSRMYPAGFSQNYNFKIKIPDSNVVQSVVPNNNITNVLRTVASITGYSSNLHWKVKVRLDAKGLDLSSKKNIKINFVDKPANVSTI